MECKYWKKKGPNIDKCYKLNGYPTGYNFGRGRKIATHVKENESNEELLNMSSSGNAGSKEIIQDQYQRLMDMMKRLDSSEG